MRILHPSGGRLSMRFNDLRLHNTDTVQVGETSSYLLFSPGVSGEVLIFILVIFPSQQFYAKLKVTFSVPTDTVSQELTGPGLQVGISET